MNILPRRVPSALPPTDTRLSQAAQPPTPPPVLTTQHHHHHLRLDCAFACIALVTTKLLHSEIETVHISIRQRVFAPTSTRPRYHVNNDAHLRAQSLRSTTTRHFHTGSRVNRVASAFCSSQSPQCFIQNRFWRRPDRWRVFGWLPTWSANSQSRMCCSRISRIM